MFEGTVQASTWLGALQAGRHRLGEEGGIPPGASCHVAPDGVVTIQDAVHRRRYLLVPSSEPAPAPIDIDIDIGSTQPPTPGPAPQRFRRVSPRPARARDLEVSVPPPPPVAALRRRKRPPAPSSPPPDTVEGKLISLAARDEEPTRRSPIHFRERLYAVPSLANGGTAEKLATKLLRRAQKELSDVDGAKFIRIEVYNHIWQVSPQRPPVVRIEWKDWTRSIDIEFPLEDEARSRKKPPSSGPPRTQEDRLAKAFEACHDLLFLHNRAEALSFAVHLLDDLIGCEASAAALLDMNTDKFRVVSAKGAGAERRQGQGLPSNTGLLSAASSLSEHSMLTLANAKGDPRFDERVDGVPGLDVRALLYRPLVRRGRLYGMLQLANGAARKMFSQADCEIVDYVAEQLSSFVARGNSRPPPDG